MSFIYHLKPDPMEGHHLIPLNDMDKESDLYKGHSRKYEGRESLPEQIIPILNCKWNDVVQFSALDPRIIVSELKKYQHDLALSRPYIYKVPISEIIKSHDAVIFDRDSTRGKGSFSIMEHEVKVLNERNYTELSEVPQETIDYWKRVQKEGGKFLFFPFITHVMVKGAIDVSNFELVQF